MLIDKTIHLGIEMAACIISIDAVVAVGISIGVKLLIGFDKCISHFH